MQKLNKILLEYIYGKVVHYVNAGNERLVDKWADVWFMTLKQCPEELKKLKYTHQLYLDIDFNTQYIRGNMKKNKNQQRYFNTTKQVLKPIMDFYIRDKILLIRFLKKEHYTNRKIAEVLGCTPGAITHFLKRHKEVV